MKKTLILMAAVLLSIAACKPEPAVTIGAKEVVFSAEGGSKVVNIVSNYDWEAYVEGQNSTWCTVDNAAGEMNAPVTVKVDENFTGEDRSCTIIIKVGYKKASVSDIITVKQECYAPQLTINDAPSSIASEGGEYVIKFSSNYDYTISCDAADIQLSHDHGISGSDYVVLNVPGCPEIEGRDVKVTFRCENNGSFAQQVVILRQEGGKLYYGGVGYAVVKMKDGRWWMAENLRYVPDGKSVSDDASDGSGLWYPCVSNTDKTADKTADGIAQKGYLYDMATALGVSAITAENCATFDGAQGICPNGWHIPTALEAYALVGQMNNVADSSTAPYVGTTNLPALNADGFNMIPYCYINRTASTAKGAYQALVSAVDSQPSMGYWVLSTMRKVLPDGTASNYKGSIDEWGGWSYATPTYNTDNTVKNIQFYGLMTTRNASNDKLVIANSNYLSGMFVRCIKNK